MNRKLIIIAAGAGLVTFVGAFATGWLTGPSAAMGSAATPPNTGQANPPALPPPITLSPTLTTASSETATRTLTEQRLKDLIGEVRQKIQEYNRRLRDLDKEDQRLQIAQQTLNKDIETLNNLRVELAASVADLKSEREMLRKAQVQIAQTEKSNLIAIAAAYDKMDSIRASEILMNMAAGKSKSGASGTSAVNIDDAVKILHFMQDRTKANVLAEVVASEPALAAWLCQKLKQIQDGK